MYHPSIVAKNRALLSSTLGVELRDYSFSEVDEFAYRMRNVKPDVDEVNKTLLAQPQDIQKYIFNEMNLCKVDFRYFCERYCKILTPAKRLEPLRLWPSQEFLLKKLGDEELKQSGNPWVKLLVMILKSRQVGGTAISEAIVAHSTLLNPKTWGLIASDNMNISSPKLWQIFMRMYDNLPWWMRPEADTKVKASNLHLKDLDSDVVMGAGNQKNTLAQGQTVDVAHLTEVSTWEAVDAIDEDLLPAFMSSEKHHSLLLLESTGHGAKGNWYFDNYTAAIDGKNEYIPVFIAWYLRDSYKRSAEGITLKDETLKLAIRIKREQGFELSKEQMAWYQVRRDTYAATNKLGTFLQEFPSCVEEAFQTGFKAVFDIDLRADIKTEMRDPVEVWEFLPDEQRFIQLGPSWHALEGEFKWNNKLIIWERAKLGYSYVIGGDSSYGIEGKDNSAIEVVRVGNLRDRDEQVAEFCGNLPPGSQAFIYEFLGYKVYADPATGMPAMVAIEVNPGSPGIVPQNDLLNRNYPNFFTMVRPGRLGKAATKELGWHTTPGTRPLLTETGVKAIRDKDLIVNSEFLLKEMVTYVDKGIGKMKRHYEHADGYHDDRIMALFIAFYVAHEADVREIAEERRRAEDASKRPERSFMPPGGFAFSTRLHSELLDEWEDRVSEGFSGASGL